MMNQFFTYQFISDTIKEMETGYWILDMMLKASLPLYLVLSNDLRYFNYLKQKLQIISDIIHSWDRRNRNSIPFLGAL